ncbi:MAG: hypothetical protein A3F43_03790 [Gammaproteobacteria bacterium RIFCSPHIGHO2_12_FULL_42_10]|nr:MAG: hypothetical protein A3F43_03790 [Gammaproteobacteria bacterium RIFCSPHIGHO2_12_FULL_42_10]
MPKISRRIIRFRIPEIVCPNCAQSIRTLLGNDLNIAPKTVYIDIPTKEVAIVIDSDRPESDHMIMQHVKNALQPMFTLSPTRLIWPLILKGILGTIAGIALVVLMVGGWGIPLIGSVLIAAVSSVLTLYLGWNIYQSAFLTLFKTRRLNMDALFTISTLVALVVSIVACFVPGLPMMFDAALLILGFRQLGLAIEESAKKKILTGLTFDDRMPRVVAKFEDDQWKEVSVGSLKAGDVITIPKGEVIPVDGRCDDACSFVHETNYNGNPDPIAISRGRLLRSGCRVGQTVSSMQMTVLKTYDESYHMKIDNMIFDLQNKRASVEKTADKILRYFVPIVIIIACIAGIVVGCFFPPALAIQCVVATLVSACPCTLGFIIPLVVNVGIKKGREQGVFFKGGEPLEATAEVNTIVFDLNGTLTTGQKTVNSVSIMPDAIDSSSAIMKILTLLESRAKDSHTVAEVILDYTQKRLTEPLTEAERDSATVETLHSGVIGRIADEEYLLGNMTMMRERGVQIASAVSEGEIVGVDQVIYLAKGNRVLAKINISDPLRKDASAVICALKKSGKDVHLCTGSDEVTAAHYANQLGIPVRNIQFNCIPCDVIVNQNVRNEKMASLAHQNDIIARKTKLKVIQDLQKLGRKVAFIGDGGNDAPAMTACLGIAVQSDTTDAVTEAEASVLIQGPRLRPLLAAFAVSCQTIRNIKLSLGVSLAYNMTTLLLAGGLLVSIGFVLNPAVGVLLMIAQACLLLGMTYYYQRKPLKLPSERGMNSTNRVLPILVNDSPRSTVTVRNEQRIALLAAIETPEIPANWLLWVLCSKKSSAGGRRAIVRNNTQSNQLAGIAGETQRLN